MIAIPTHGLRPLRKVFPWLFMLLFLASCSASRHAQRAQARKEERANEALLKKYEGILGEKIEEENLPLYKCIDKWMGTRYKYGAAGPSGTDCSGFTGIVYQEVYHIKLPRSSEDQLEKAHRVKKKHLKAGNLVFFKLERGKKVSHVGIYLGNNKFVHASTSKGVRIDDLEDEYFKNSFVCGGSYF